MDRPTMDLGLPERITMTRQGTHLELTRKWFSGKYVFLIAFALFWDGFLVFWYSMVGGRVDSPVFWFPMIHVGVGVFVTYSAVAGLLNRTLIRVSRSEVSIKHGPVPWPGNKAMTGADLKQLYCKECVSRSRNGTSLTYELQAITHSGRTIKLVGGMDTSEQALYLEQEMEKYLGIADEAVKGEL
jgi:hypothetical protein